MNGEYKIGDVVLGSWTLVRLLGEGAFGKVYEAHKEDFGTVSAAAIKIMTIPSSQSEVESARAEGMDEAAVTAYFRDMAEQVVQEFRLMSELKGTTNIVSCEDHAVVPHTEGVGWDIFIRMELLTPMLRYMSGRELTRNDVIRLGIDICKALELCQKYNIIHRDIKPENIFVARTGDYKLGDFGVARTLEKTTGGLSKKGTYTYMAPEIYRDEPYGSTVDIYSLGIVLYRLLNNNRPPFLPPPPQPVSYSEREQALQRRIDGEELPPPANAEGRLSEIVLKACAWDPKDRYSSPGQMRQELEAIAYPRGEDELIYGKDGKIRVERSAFTKQGGAAEEATVYDPQRSASSPGEDRTVSVLHGKTEDADKTVSALRASEDGAKKQSEPPKKKKGGLIAGVAAALVLVAGALIFLLPKLKAADPGASPSPAVPASAPPVMTTPQPAAETAPPTPEPVAETPAPAVQTEDSWVILDTKGKEGEVTLLSYYVSDGRQIANPDAFQYHDETWVSFEWIDNTTTYTMLVAEWDEKPFTEAYIQDRAAFYLRLWQKDVPLQKSPQNEITSGFPGVPGSAPLYVLLLGIGKDYTLDSYVILEVGIPQKIITLDESWDYGAVKISTVDQQTLHVELTDDRIPDGFPHSKTPGSNEEIWDVILDFGRDTALYSVIDLRPSARSLNDFHLTAYIGKGDAMTDMTFPKCTLKGNTFSFDIRIPESSGYSLKDIQTIYVDLGTETDYLDRFSYIVG